MFEAAPESLIAREPRGLKRAALNAVWSTCCKLLGQARYDDYRVEHVADARLLILPTVANPAILRTGAYFAEAVAAVDIRPGSTVLDMGTGSGVCALVAARRARHVVAVDINPAAVRCARINALINRLEERIDCRQGDLFEPVVGERFDLVLFNPPFLLGEPGSPRDAAWRSSDAAQRFAANLAAHLSPGGYALLLLSSFGDASAVFEAALRGERLALSVHATRRYFNEVLTVLRVQLLESKP
jgi:HemK-related putative methylase